MRKQLALLFFFLGLTCASAQDVSNPSCNGPWVSYAATATSQTPGITPPTLAVSRSVYKLCGNKTVTVSATVTVTAAGTGTGALRLTLPFTGIGTAEANYVGSAVEIASNGISGSTSVLAFQGSTFASISPATGIANTYIITGQKIVATVVYEIP